MTTYNYIDLFAGAGGLSEGFMRHGFIPIAHVEADQASCFTLQTRMAYYYYKQNNIDTYYSYLRGEISRKELYSKVPEDMIASVIHARIGSENTRIYEEIDNLLGEKSVDLIIGGPPCQAYSKIGRPALKHKLRDERTMLYVQYGRYLNRYRPKMFVFENVPGIYTTENGKYLKNLKKYYRRLGYQVEDRVLNAYDYGVVQNRERVIIVGWRKEINHPFKYPKTISVKHFRDEIFFDLPPIGPGESRRFQEYNKPTNEYLKLSKIRNGSMGIPQHITRTHNAQDLDIYKLAITRYSLGERITYDKIPNEVRTQRNTTDFVDRFKVVGDEPHTLIAHIAKDGHHYIHPNLDQLRSISVREAARIQSFPDDYYFESVIESSSHTQPFKQIGNAVPPLMAEHLAKAVMRMFDE